MKTFKQILFSVMILLVVVSCDKPRTLVILHVNDNHSNLETIRTGRNVGMGGVERRLQFIDAVREEYGKDNVLLLDGGDYNQGTPYFTIGKGDVEVALNNVLGLDVATLGNHEFDNGQEELARRLSSANYQTVTCNYDFTGTVLEEYIKPYTIVKRGGYKIGIIGVTAYLAGSVLTSHLGGMKQLDTIEEVNKWAEYLKAKQKCEIVILLSHRGYFVEGPEEYPCDKDIAAASSDIDIIIGGHSHTFLDEPTMIKNQKGIEIPIVQDGCWGVNVGKFVITD